MEKNNKTYITISFFILTFLVLIFFIIYPLLKGIQTSSESLISAKNEIARNNLENEQMQDFINNYDYYRATLEKIDKLFIDEKNPVDFIKFIEKTALKYKFSSKISLSLMNSQPTNESIAYLVSLKGPFNNIISFTKNIEIGPYLVEIEDLIIQNSEKKEIKDNLGQVDAQFTIKAFLQNNGQ